jgi:O-antigen ligase
LSLGQGRDRSWAETVAQHRVPRTVGTLFVVAVPTLLIAVSEFKFRTRESDSALSGSVDSAVLMEVALYALVGLWMVALMVGAPRARTPTPIDGLLRLWVGFTVVSIAWSDYQEFASVRAMELVVIAMLASIIGSRATRDQVHRLAHTYVVLMSVAAIVGTRWHTPVSRLQATRFSFLSVHPVTAAAMWAIATVLAFNWAMNVRRLSKEPQARVWARWVHIGCFAICGWALIRTETRGAVAAAVAGVALTWVMSVHRRNRIPAIFIAVLGLGVAAALVLDKAVEFIVRGEGTATLSTLNNRLPLWELAMERFNERPLFGWGFGATRGIFLDEVGLGGAHNAYINLLVDLGAVGAAVWLGLIIAMALGIRSLRRAGDIDAPVMAGLLVTMLVNALTTEGLGSGYGALTVWLMLLAAWIRVGRRSHRPRSRTPRIGLAPAGPAVTDDPVAEPPIRPAHTGRR